ncbi:MAG: asparagine synthase (glutamine-hydrolyzing) [Alphaproteobacteria bacterium]|nr:asparagine synthase (glutamine-hydrolyzing) [Alphaproteobacteria bacterium]
MPENPVPRLTQTPESGVMPAMCGLAGLLTRDMAGPPLASLAEGMANALAHRGPDSAGVWCDDRAGIALAHRRLSVFDLSNNGRQPMTSTSGRYVAIFNGAIYNFRHLARTLAGAGFKFSSSSDTEVMLAAFDHWGVVEALAKFDGMFAIAVWDNRERRLSLIRDRVGKKPLYYGHVGTMLAFASELKAVLTLPGFERKIDPNAAHEFFRFGYVPSPFSIYRDFAKLPPGHIAEIKSDGQSFKITLQSYWKRSDFKPDIAPPSELQAKAKTLLSDAVAARMVADVPLGAFLSGGYDSTAVVALMQRHASTPVRTFTVGSIDPAIDEAAHARAVAHHLGTDHTELRLEPSAALGVIEDLPAIYDEPFADESQIPTILVARMARRQVTVALSGDGGDEVFGGYNRHRLGPKIARASALAPSVIRSGLAWMLRAPSAHLWDAIGSMIGQSHMAERVDKFAQALPASDASAVYDRLTTRWRQAPTTHGSDSPPWHDPGIDREAGDLMMYRDFVGYLPDDILVKVDRATMSVGLEARAPFLDHRLVEFMASVPWAAKLEGGVGKKILRDIVHTHVPKTLMERPKVGFDVPLGSWLRGPLKEWGSTLLTRQALDSSGVINAELITQAWTEHQSENANRPHDLWAALMFQAWMRRYNASL